MRYADTELQEKIGGYKSIRLTGMICFKLNNSWSEARRAIIDTGAHISLIPFSVWKNACAQKITDHYLKGVVPKKECIVPVLIGNVKCFLMDDANETEEMRILAYLALIDEIPLIIGFKDLLERFKLTIDYQNNTAYIEESKLDRKNNPEG